MIKLLLGIIFLVGMYFDLKYRGLPKWFLIGGFLGSSIGYLMKRPVAVEEMIGGLVLGIFLVIISFITRGALGSGDGIFLGIVGINLGFTNTGVICVYGLLLSACFSLFMLIFKKVSRKTSIPFIPFLTVAYGIFILINKTGG